VTYHASAIWTGPAATLQQRQSGRHRLGRRRRDEKAAESSDSETNYERPDCKSLLSAASVSVAPKNLPTQLLENGHLPQKFFESGAPTSRSDSGTPAARLHIVLQNLTSGQLQLGTNLLTSPVQGEGQQLDGKAGKRRSTASARSSDCASMPAINTTSQEGGKAPAIASTNLPMRYHNLPPAGQQLNLPGGRCKDRSADAQAG
jgi:hypothetical protein